MKKILCCVLALVMCLSVFVSCDKQEDASNLDSAKEIIYNMYKDKAAATNSDYTVVSVVMVGDEKFTVEWTAEVSQGQPSDVTIKAGETESTVDVNESTSSEVVYKLTAVIKDAAGKTASVSFDHTIPAYKEFDFNDYKATEKGGTVVVKGVVTGVISKSKGNTSNGLYLQDNVGGFYVYNIADDPVEKGIKEGMTVKVSGKKDIYNGTYEIIEANVEIVDDTIIGVSPVDYTEIFKSAKDLKDEALVDKQALFVTVKGVEVTDEVESSGYYKFKLGDKESYVRISSSVCPLLSDEQKTFKADHASHTGYIADVKGVICVYDGAFYLTPVTTDSFTYLSLPEKTDKEKVAFEKGNLKLDSKVSEAKEFTLPAKGGSYDTVAIAWESDNACAVVKDGKLTVTLPATDQKVTVTATLTCGTEKDTQKFEITVEAAQSKTYTATKIETPAKDTAYKFGFVQATVSKTLYFAGEMSGNYFATTANPEKATDVFVEEVTGGYRLYFMKDGKKTYLDIYEYQSGKAGLQLTEAPTATYTWDAATFTFFASVAGDTYYMGTYKNYETVSTSKTSYITGSNASSVEVSQFPAHLWTLKEA